MLKRGGPGAFAAKTLFWNGNKKLKFFLRHCKTKYCTNTKLSNTAQACCPLAILP